MKIKVNKFRKEVWFRETVRTDQALTAALERIYGSEDAEILEMDTRMAVAHSGVLRRAADAFLASL